MPSRRSRALASDPASAAGLDRRLFLLGSAAVLATAWARPASAAEAGFALPDATRRLLAESPFVYVSPLRRDGSESTCHGEVWYCFLDDSVLLVTSKTAWKAQSLSRGLDRARIWVGDHGRWKRGPLRSEDFRKAPSFVARVERETDAPLFDRVMALYRERYPAEIGTWEPRFREGFRSGERVMLRYRPDAA